jgi:hypothetical protein
MKTFETIGGRQVAFVPELDFTDEGQMRINPVLVEGLSVRFQSDFLPVHWTDDLLSAVRLEFEAVFAGEFYEIDRRAVPHFDVSASLAVAANKSPIGKQAIRGLIEKKHSPLIYAARHIADKLELPYYDNCTPSLGRVVKDSLHYLLPE